MIGRHRRYAMLDTPAVIDSRQDFAAVCLGDLRLDKRLLDIAAALQERPAASFPEALGGDAAAEGFYRFLANERVDWADVLEGHAEATRRRSEEVGSILAIHDTSTCAFGGAGVREGAFAISSKKSGFLAHTCLAVAADGSRQPLGVLGMIPVVRLEGEAAAASPGTVYPVESHRWHDLVAVVDDEVSNHVDVTHVMDSEGDSFGLLAFMVQLEADFVVRLCRDREVVTSEGDGRLQADVLGDTVHVVDRSVLLSRRTSTQSKATSRNPHRDERSATLEIRVGEANLLRPNTCDAELAAVHVNIVQVIEKEPPADEKPVSWVLATTRPVDTLEQIEAVVDAYRARWLIEEWFKSLKTGCAYLSRQLESLDALLTAFALLAPTATRLLAIRWFARNEPERPARDVMSKAEIRCLRLLERKQKRSLPRDPTVSDVMFAIARMGGFLKSNKTPGWQTLGKGMVRFNSMFEMYAVLNEGAEM